MLRIKKGPDNMNKWQKSRGTQAQKRKKRTKADITKRSRRQGKVRHQSGIYRPYSILGDNDGAFGGPILTREDAIEKKRAGALSMLFGKKGA